MSRTDMTTTVTRPPPSRVYCIYTEVSGGMPYVCIRDAGHNLGYHGGHTLIRQDRWDELRERESYDPRASG